MSDQRQQIVDQVFGYFVDRFKNEFAGQLAGRAGVFDDAPNLVHAYYEVVFGRRRLSPERLDHIQAFLERIRRLDKTQLDETQKNPSGSSPAIS